MMNKFFNSIFGLLAIVALLAGEAYADTFESLFFTPPNGWNKQVSADKTTYQRTSGIGAIVFYAGYPANGSATDEFNKMWRTRLEPILSVKAPQPQIQREGDLTAAVGMQAVNAQGTMTTAVLTVFVGRGRAIGVVSLFAGDDVQREVTAFFESIRVLPEKRDPISGDPYPHRNSGTVSSGGIEFDYKVPSGFTTKNDAGMIQLIPTKLDANTPCAYWISPPRPSQGSLEADARKAVLELPIERRSIDDHYHAIRGTAPDGWKYFLFGFDFRNSAGTSIAYGMAMAFPAGAGQVNIILGVGNGGTNCLTNDTNFVRLFHSLNPHGWTSDAGKAFSGELKGYWRDITRSSMSGSGNMFLTEYNFLANGRYASGRGSITTTGITETTTAIASDGSYKLSGNELTITSDSRNISKFRVRLYEDYFAGKWWRKMSLFHEELKMNKEYDRIEN